MAGLLHQIQTLQLRPIAPGDSLQELTALLHRAYRPLADMGLRYLATHQTVRDTQNRIDGGQCHIAELEGRIVGTITWYRGSERETKPTLFRDPAVAYFGQFAVEPALQRHSIGRRMLEVVEAEARRAGCTLLALDTAEGAMHLIN